MREVWMEEIGCDISSHPPIVSRSGPYSPMEEGVPWAWYDVPRLSFADADAVDTVTDFSGNGRTLTASGSTRPTFKTGIRNGLAILRSTGSQNPALSSETTIGSTYTFFMVLMESSTPNYRLMGPVDAASGHGIMSFTSVQYHRPDNDPAGVSTATVATAANQWRVDAWRRSSASAIQHYRDGTASAMSNPTFTRSLKMLTWRLALGDTGEMLIYSSALSDAAVDRINNYLCKKWGF